MNHLEIKMTEQKFDKAYLRITDEPVAETREFCGEVLADFDADGQLVGVEIIVPFRLEAEEAGQVRNSGTNS